MEECCVQVGAGPKKVLREIPHSAELRRVSG